MSNLIPDLTKIPAPRTPLIDERTGLMSREWYRFFYNLYNLAGTGGNFVSLEDIQKGPPSVPFEALQVDPNAPTNAPTDSPLVSQVDEIDKQINALESQPECPCEEYNAETQKEIDGLELLPRAELGTMAALQQANVPWLTFDTTASGVPPDVGTVAWDGGTTLGVQMTPNVLLKVGEAEYIYVKASSAITKGQVCYHTGAVGSSGVTTVAPAPIGLTDPNEIVGIAAESIALNDFGLIQISGDIKGFDTTGGSVGETWADGDSLYYNPAFVGSMTNIKPVAPNQKTYMGEVINAGSGGSGSMHIRISQGSVLGGTDSNVQFGTVNNGDLIQYDSVLQYWKNVAPSSISIGTATNLAGGLAGSVPYQTAPGTTTFLNIGTALQVLKVNAGATAPEWVSGAALTKVDDTNVTLTLGGTPATSLLAATSLTLGWTGQLGLTRGGTNASLTASAGSVVYSTASELALNTAGSTGNWLRSAGTAAPVWTAPAALTRVNDTNVTLTLGGSASTALLNAASITAGWTGQLAVSRGGTGIASGTSGGIPYFSSTTTIASSAALAANALVVGGGAGVAPSTITTGTGVVTALGVNTGTAGAFVVNGGALGTPSSGTVTNLTGTASININGTVGATTPNTGAFTTLTTSGNAGIGTASPANRLDIVNSAAGAQMTIAGSDGLYAGMFGGTGSVGPGIFFLNTAPALRFGTGTAKSVGIFTELMRLTTTGLGVGTTNPVNKLQVAGSFGRGAPVTKTGNFTLADTENWVICNGTGTITVTLPTASSWTGREFTIKTIAAFTVISSASNVVPLAGGAAGTAILAATAGTWATLVSDGTNWIIMQA